MYVNLKTNFNFTLTIISPRLPVVKHPAADKRPQAYTRTQVVVCITISAANLLYRILPHTLTETGGQCPLTYTRRTSVRRHIREPGLLYASLSCRDHTLQIFAAYRTAMHRSSLTHAADKRPQANTRTRFIVCVTIVPRTYFTDIRRILCRKQLCPSPTPYRRLTAFFFLYGSAREVFAVPLFTAARETIKPSET